MEIVRDSSGQPYIDVRLRLGEHVRVTRIAAGNPGYGCPTLRIQIRDAKGHLRQGPEIPLDVLGCVIAACIDLVRPEADADGQG